MCFTLAGIDERGPLDAVCAVAALNGEGRYSSIRPRLRHRERVHQGCEDHPVLHGHRGQNGAEEALAISLARCCVLPPSDGYLWLGTTGGVNPEATRILIGTVR